jgi:hypothetical protein
MLEEFIKYILGEWRVIANAPVSFIVAVLVLGGIIWWAMSWGGMDAKIAPEAAGCGLQRQTEWRQPRSGESEN